MNCICLYTLSQLRTGNFFTLFVTSYINNAYKNVQSFYYKYENTHNEEDCSDHGTEIGDSCTFETACTYSVIQNTNYLKTTQKYTKICPLRTTIFVVVCRFFVGNRTPIVNLQYNWKEQNLRHRMKFYILTEFIIDILRGFVTYDVEARVVYYLQSSVSIIAYQFSSIFNSFAALGSEA